MERNGLRTIRTVSEDEDDSIPILPIMTRANGCLLLVYRRHYEELLKLKERRPDIRAMETRWTAHIFSRHRLTSLSHRLFVHEDNGHVYFTYVIINDREDELNRRVEIYTPNFLMQLQVPLEQQRRQRNSSSGPVPTRDINNTHSQSQNDSGEGSALRRLVRTRADNQCVFYAKSNVASVA